MAETLSLTNPWGLILPEPATSSVVVWEYSRPKPALMVRGAFPPRAFQASALSWKKKVYSALFAIVLGSVIFVTVNTDTTSLRYAYLRLTGQTLSAEDFSDKWKEKYHIVITDRIVGTVDSDGDGLTFLEEYNYFTHPFKADTDEDGVADKAEITEGMNPRGMGELDQDEDGLSDNWEKAFGLDPLLTDAEADTDADQLTNQEEFRFGTHPKLADSDEDGFRDGDEMVNGYDPALPGPAKPAVTVLVSKVGVAAPLIWSETEEEEAMLKDLEQGVIHYPKTGIPGQKGNVIVAGHSSNYVWAKGDYNSVFRRLGEVEAGDTILLRTKLGNGKTYEYVYRIKEKRVVKPNDPWIFEELKEKSVVTLSTCWPLGTTFSRLTVRAELET